MNTFGACLEEEEYEQYHHHRHPVIVSQIPSFYSSLSSTSNRGYEALVIYIVRQMSEEDDMKSMVPTRIRSFKRLRAI